jgi:tRNA pseudouridine38-40 synthase
MPRYKILIEYDGTNFSGWQKQPHAPSIQEELDKALFKFTNEKVEVYGSGRTDAGVHALGQVAHFDLAKPWPEHTIIRATNYHLQPHKIAVLTCEEVSPDFHARFSAKQRAYKYIILNRISPPTIEATKVWQVKEPLNIPLMQQAAKLFEGTHDFTCIKTSSCQAKSYIRTIDYIKISKLDDHITIEIAAPSFIHNMVRNIVGALRQIGNQSWTEAHITALLSSTSPSPHKLTAPPFGLYLERIQF